MFFSVQISQMRLRRPTVANPRVPKDMIVLPDGRLCRASDPETLMRAWLRFIAYLVKVKLKRFKPLRCHKHA